MKKEPEPPTETLKQEEREPAAKSSAPAPPSKPPPEKRARLQWQPYQLREDGTVQWKSPAAVTRRTPQDGEHFCFLPKSSATLLVRSVYRVLRMNCRKKCHLPVSLPGLLLLCNLSHIHLIGLAWIMDVSGTCSTNAGQLLHVSSYFAVDEVFLMMSWPQRWCQLTVDVSTVFVGPFNRLLHREMVPYLIRKANVSLKWLTSGFEKNTLHLCFVFFVLKNISYCILIVLCVCFEFCLLPYIKDGLIVVFPQPHVAENCTCCLINATIFYKKIQR